MKSPVCSRCSIADLPRIVDGGAAIFFGASAHALRSSVRPRWQPIRDSAVRVRKRKMVIRRFFISNYRCNDWSPPLRTALEAESIKSERTILGRKKPRIITDATDRRELSVTIRPHLSKSAVSSASISPVSIHQIEGWGGIRRSRMWGYLTITSHCHRGITYISDYYATRKQYYL